MRRPLRLAVACAVLLPAAARAQARDSTLAPAAPETPRPSRVAVGLSGLAAVPRGEFAANVGSGVQGGGADLSGLLRLDRAGFLSLRVDAAGLWYGRERVSAGLISPRLDTHVVTTNQIWRVAVGPEFAVPAGPIRPYVNGSVAVHGFQTSSDLEAPDGGNADGAFTTTNQSDATLAWGVGAGVRIPIAPARVGLTLDLGTSYLFGGSAEYLRKGDLVDNPDGSLTMYPRRSRTDFQTFHVGLSLDIHAPASGGRR